MMAYLRRELPETERFERYRATRSRLPSLSGLLGPLVSLVRMYPGRFIATGSVIFLVSPSGQPAGFFFPKYMLDVHGWQPCQFSVLGGVIALFVPFIVALAYPETSGRELEENSPER